jgi:hypothetical protein
VGGGTLREHHPTVRKQLSEVVEEDHAVAQETPSLLGVGGNGVGRLAVGAIGCWALRLV